MHQLKGIDSLWYSFGEDYNYKIRLNTLVYKRDLGEGGFGTVHLMHDSLMHCDVAVKFIPLRSKNGRANSHLM